MKTTVTEGKWSNQLHVEQYMCPHAGDCGGFNCPHHKPHPKSRECTDWCFPACGCKLGPCEPRPERHDCLWPPDKTEVEKLDAHEQEGEAP